MVDVGVDVSALMLPDRLFIEDWLFIEGVTAATAWVEIGNLAVLNAVAVIVGERVEREGRARPRAEEALRQRSWSER